MCNLERSLTLLCWSAPGKRPVEGMLYKETKVLDSGFLDVETEKD